MECKVCHPGSLCMCSPPIKIETQWNVKEEDRGSGLYPTPIRIET